MRRFIVAYPDGSAHTQDAEKMTMGDNLTACFHVGEEIVGFARGWSAISSEPHVFGPATITTAPVEMTERERSIVESAQQSIDSGYPIEGTVEAMLAERQASPPDEEGVSTDPYPGPEGDVDANPPENPPSEDSTEADDPSASDDGDSAERDALKLTLGRTWASLRQKPVLDEYVTWAKSEGFEVVLSDMTTDQMRRSVAWLEEHT